MIGAENVSEFHVNTEDFLSHFSSSPAWAKGILKGFRKIRMDVLKEPEISENNRKRSNSKIKEYDKEISLRR